MIVNANDFEKEARKILPIQYYEYFSSGSNDEVTLKRNKKMYQKIYLNPKMLVNVGKINLSTQIFGDQLKLPFGIAPTAFQKLCHPNGEINCLKAAQNNRFIYTLSSLSNTSIDEIIQQNQSAILWFQLYITKSKLLTQKIIELAEKSGFKALVITIDSPVISKREGEVRNKFTTPKNVKLEILKTFTEIIKTIPQNELRYLFKDPTVTWDDIKELKKLTKLPVILKGVMSPESARKCQELGCHIWISNHGGRQLDTTLSTIETLFKIKQSISINYRNKTEKDNHFTPKIFIDGGVRRGTDILKLLALGADYIFLGRSPLYAMACDGEKGITKLFDILQEELKIAMQLSGCTSINQIDDSIILNVYENKNKEKKFSLKPKL